MRFRNLTPAWRTAIAAILILAIALLDWRVDLNITFGFLYLLPVMVLGTAAGRGWIVLTAALCTFLANFFDPFPLALASSAPQDFLVFAALTGTGLFSYEVANSRRREAIARRTLETEVTARREAEEQLAFLIESSPAAILTMTTGGEVLRANSGAERLFGAPPGTLAGQSISNYLPALGRVVGSGKFQVFRTGMRCRGERSGGEIFLAEVYFSTYHTAQGPRLAALAVDVTEEMRDREESTLEQLMSGSRILVGAVSHEIRNVCGAIAVVHQNLTRTGGLDGNKDFEALGALVETLGRIASVELSSSSEPAEIEAVDPAETLEDLRIVIDPYCQDAGIDVKWHVPKDLPRVWADPHRLLQVLLNLAKNSERALEATEAKRIEISASGGAGVVSIRVTDSGPGLTAAGKLFQPFQQGAEHTGLGLYLSRAFVRSFRGELRHDPTVAGCSFVIDLAVAENGLPGRGKNAPDATVAGR
jgi:two-component system, LuxR family, sensor kinase FixL